MLINIYFDNQSLVQELAGKTAENLDSLIRLCHQRCELAGELDNFRFDPDEFQELFDLQFGDTQSALKFAVSESGLPALNHWTAQDVRRLADQMKAVDAAEREEYTQDVFGDVLGWITRLGTGNAVFLSVHKARGRATSPWPLSVLPGRTICCSRRRPFYRFPKVLCPAGRRC